MSAVVVRPLRLGVMLKRVSVFLLYWVVVQNVEVIGCRFSWPAGVVQVESNARSRPDTRYTYTGGEGGGFMALPIAPVSTRVVANI